MGLTGLSWSVESKSPLPNNEAAFALKNAAKLSLLNAAYRPGKKSHMIFSTPHNLIPKVSLSPAVRTSDTVIPTDVFSASSNFSSCKQSTHTYK
jgi:hypothetical protein